MIIGIVLKDEARPVVDACLKERLLVNATAGNVLRLLPPLNLSREEADQGLAIIRRALEIKSPAGAKTTSRAAVRWLRRSGAACVPVAAVGESIPDFR